ncbi:hypothetical protein [Gimesia aquarii]|uniref:Uncharacterized protein n=1 Tax=Gimesia aquarii TaxID=2527964 RepID=A0A517VTD1_9PLAN|nr:hypothetical protein [Gimesia aquarii]QDT96266.1 hypothetical protein V144x_17200 [Gimesia aquarii]
MTTEKPLDKKILEWLEQQGYPLEMRVAKAFIDAGVSISLSVYYRDPENDTPREIDIVAGCQDGEFADYFMFSVEFAIECKKSSSPWVLFVKPGRSFGSVFRNGWVCSKIGSTVKERLKYRNLSDNKLHNWSGNWAYGVTEALRKGSPKTGDIPYKALMSCVKASHGLARLTEQKVWSSRYADKVLFGSMTQPVIILDGKLFEASLNESGDLEIIETEEGIINFKYPFLNRADEYVSVRIVTLPALPRFISAAKETVEQLTDEVDAQQQAYKEHLIVEQKA